MNAQPFVAVVTGASSGIGEATARRLAREPGARLVLVARREERLRALAESLGVPASFVAVDLTSDGAPAEVLRHVRDTHGRLDLLVNNAGAAWRARFADGGHANVSRTMELNFDAQVRLTEALLPLLRESAPSAIVNVSSVSGRVARAGSGAYSASKFALAGWSDSLYLEERANGVHVGLVLPGLRGHRGLPGRGAQGAPGHPLDGLHAPSAWPTRSWTPGPGGKAERYVPRPYFLATLSRVLTPAPVPARDVGRRRGGDDHAHGRGRGDEREGD